jgi:uncharacterized cupin superfamily protein
MKKAVEKLWTSLEDQQSRNLETLLVTHTDKRFTSFLGLLRFSILFITTQPGERERESWGW